MGRAGLERSRWEGSHSVSLHQSHPPGSVLCDAICHPVCGLTKCAVVTLLSAPPALWECRQSALGSLRCSVHKPPAQIQRSGTRTGVVVRRDLPWEPWGQPRPRPCLCACSQSPQQRGPDLSPPREHPFPLGCPARAAEFTESAAVAWIVRPWGGGSVFSLTSACGQLPGTGTPRAHKGGTQQEAAMAGPTLPLAGPLTTALHFFWEHSLFLDAVTSTPVLLPLSGHPLHWLRVCRPPRVWVLQGAEQASPPPLAVSPADLPSHGSERHPRTGSLSSSGISSAF